MRHRQRTFWADNKEDRLVCVTSVTSHRCAQTDLKTSQNGMVVRRNSGKESANAETGIAVERQSRRSGNIAYDLRHIGL